MHTIVIRRLYRWLLIPSLIALIALTGSRPEGTRAAAQTGKEQPSDTGRETACDGPEDYRDVPRLGHACRRADGMWQVMLSDGKIVVTHGPDAPPEKILASDPMLAGKAPMALNCVGASAPHAVALYVYPTDRADQFGARVPTIRSYIQGMQDKLNSESSEFGVSSSYNVLCDGDGQATVRRVPLSLNSAQNNIGAITSDLQSKGYNSTIEKYWIFYEQSGCGGGVAWAETDDRAIATNHANQGPSYAISWGMCGYEVAMHESGHTMGAVMNSAPNTTGAGHCIDGSDIMCYNDGGPRGGLYNPNSPCGDRKHFDCNHNDYFHPSPAAGSYLATHWNIGACYNSFITRSGCGGPPPTGGGGYFFLVNRSSGKCADVANGSTADGAAVQQWTCNGTTAQQWQLAAADSGYYRLVARNSGKCADMDAWSTADGGLVLQWTCGANQSNQQWNFQPTADGWFRVANRNSGKFLSVVNGSTADGMRLHQWPWLGNPDQQWRLEPVGVASLVNKNSGKCADVASSGTADGVNVQQWTCNGTGAQKWAFQHTDNGYYRVVAQVSGKVLDVAGGATADGANIQQWSWNGGGGQQWRIEPLGDGSFRLIARNSGKVVDVSGSGTGDGANIQLWTWNGSNAQRFSFGN